MYWNTSDADGLLDPSAFAELRSGDDDQWADGVDFEEDEEYDADDEDADEEDADEEDAEEEDEEEEDDDDEWEAFEEEFDDDDEQPRHRPNSDWE